jgi:PAS domain S-box-containing protein
VLPHEWASAQAVEKGLTVTGQMVEIQRFDGRRAFVINNAAPVRDVHGRIVGSAVSIQDMTALKKAEAEIQHLASFPQANPNPILEIDRHGAVTYANPATAALLERLGQPADPHAFAPLDLDAIRQQAAQDESAQLYRELPLGDAVFAEDIYLLPQFDAIRIYARDITKRVRSERERRQAEEARRLSEEKFALAFSNNPAAIALTRLEDGLFLDVNQTWEALNGYRREEVVGRSARQLPMWPSAEAAAHFVRELREKGAVRGWEQAFLKRSGEVFVAQLSAQILTVQGEDVILSTMVDITERKQAEEALRRSRQKNQEILDSIQDGFMEIDRNWCFTYLNQRAAQNLGYTPEQLVGRNIWDAFPALLGTDQEAFYRQVMDQRQPAQIEVDGVLTHRCYELHAYPSSEGLTLFWADTTERKCMEEALRESESKFMAIFQNAPMAIALSRLPEGVLVDVNPAFEKLFEGRKEDVLGRTSAELGIAPDPQTREELLAQIKRQGYAHHQQHDYRTMTGKPIVISGNIDLITIDGEKFVLNTFEDITERVRAEQARQQAIAEAEEGKRILEALMRYVPEGITIAEGPDVTIRLVSQFGQDLLGGTHAQKTAEEVADQWKVYAADGLTPLPDEELPLVQAIRRGEVVHNQDLVQINAQGRKLHLSCNAGPIRDAAGKITGAIVAWRDISERFRAEAERTRLLAEVEKRAAELEAIISSMATRLIVYNAAGNAIRMNETAKKLFRPELFSTTTVADRVRVVQWQKENGQPFAPEEIPVARALRGETIHNVVIAAPFPDHTVWIAASAAPIGTPEGQLLGAVASFIDISERKQAERLIQDQKELLGAQNEELTAQRDELQSQNEELAAQQEELLQYRDELEGRVRERTDELETANAVLEDEIEERRQAEERVRQTAQRLAVLAEVSESLVAAGPVYRATLDQIVRAIALSIGDACSLRLLSDDGLRLEMAACYHVDPGVSEKLRGILAAGSASVSEGIAGRVFQTKEPTFMPALTPEELRRQIRPSLLPHLDPVAVAGLIVVPLVMQTKVLGTLAVFRTSAECPYTSEDLRLLQSLADRVALATANAGLFRDLERALAQEQAMHQQLAQAEKLGALGRMVSSVAHELNNPLQTITNCLYLTAGELPPDSTIHQYLEMATAETQRLVSLVAQLRELYRPRTVASETHDLIQLLRSVQVLMAAQLQAGHVQWQQPADLPDCAVQIISDRLKQVFINVVTNAVEAMQPAGGELHVDLVRSANGNQVGVRFKDTGPGIAPEHLSRLFEPFFTTKAHGLGLGLAICYEIAQQHGGQITAESQPGQGAVFTTWLPLAQPPDGGDHPATPEDQSDANRQTTTPDGR